MAVNILQKLVVGIVSTTLSLGAIETSPAQALIRNFSFYNHQGRVGQVAVDSTKSTYYSLRFWKIFPVPTSGSYKIFGDLTSGDFSIKFDVGLRLRVIKQYSYWQLYDAEGRLIGQSPRSGQRWGGCNDVTPNQLYPCVFYNTQYKSKL